MQVFCRVLRASCTATSTWIQLRGGRRSPLQHTAGTDLTPLTLLAVAPAPVCSLNLATEAKGIAGDAEIARIIAALPDNCPMAGKECKK